MVWYYMSIFGHPDLIPLEKLTGCLPIAIQFNKPPIQGTHSQSRYREALPCETNVEGSW